MENHLTSKSILEKISYHVVYDVNLHDAIDFAARNGFSGIQVAVEVPRFSPERYTSANQSSIRAHAEKAGIRISLNAPDAVTSLFTTHPALKRGVRDYYEDLFNFARGIGVDLITIHLGLLPTYSQHRIPGTMPVSFDDAHFYESLLKKNLEWICQKCPKEISLCVENYAFDELIQNILGEMLSEGNLFLCWDIAKTFTKELKINSDIESFFLKNIKYVKQCHLHDIVPGFSAHQVIGSGSLNIIDFLIKLQRAPILDYCIEVRPREKALESLNNLKKMLSQFNKQMQHWQNLAFGEPDEEVNSINRLERHLQDQDLITEKVLSIRRQISFLELTHFLFFENLESICSNIGQLTAERPLFTCMTINEERRSAIENYLTCLKSWLESADFPITNSSLFIKIKTLLGQPGRLKKILVERLVVRIEFSLTRTMIPEQQQAPGFSYDRFGGLDDSDDLLVRRLRQEGSALTLDYNQFEQHIAENYVCHHKFFRHLDIIIENIGLERWNARRQLKGTDGYIRAVQTRKYLSALKNWLQPAPPEDSGENPELIQLLGTKTQVKEWLVKSLYKTLFTFSQIMQEIGTSD